MKKISFKKLSAEVQSLLADIGSRADAGGFSVFLVGGMVRDILLGRPSLDVDVVVEGDGLAFATMLGKAWKARVLAHRKFGTAVVTRHDGVKVDVVTARRETYAHPGILPDVIPGQLSDDLFRRDFTINAIAASLNARDFGVLRDDFDGIKDIEDGLVRIMNYRSFIDDPTRILRAVRYEKRFGFKCEQRTLAALREAIEENAFRFISAVRYFNEFRRILQEADPQPALRRLVALDSLRYFVYDDRTEARFRAVLRSPAGADERWTSLFAALILSLDRDSAEDLFVSFNMPREEKKLVLRALDDYDTAR